MKYQLDAVDKEQTHLELALVSKDFERTITRIQERIDSNEPLDDTELSNLITDAETDLQRFVSRYGEVTRNLEMRLNRSKIPAASHSATSIPQSH